MQRNGNYCPGVQYRAVYPLETHPRARAGQVAARVRFTVQEAPIIFTEQTRHRADCGVQVAALQSGVQVTTYGMNIIIVVSRFNAARLFDTFPLLSMYSSRAR